MRKVLSTLSMAALLASGSAMSDQTTLNALQKAEVQMSSAVQGQVKNAAATDLVAIEAAIQAVVRDLGTDTTAIAAAVRAAVTAHPTLAHFLASAAASVAPLEASEVIISSAVDAAVESGRMTQAIAQTMVRAYVNQAVAARQRGNGLGQSVNVEGNPDDSNVSGGNSNSPS